MQRPRGFEGLFGLGSLPGIDLIPEIAVQADTVASGLFKRCLMP
ncbi:MAG: hypothetical protein ACT6U0_18820 [Shinella sp.]